MSYLKGFAPMPPAPFFSDVWRCSGIEAKLGREQRTKTRQRKTTQTLEDETLGPHMKPIWASEGPNMVPKWAENRFKIAPWRLLGEPWAALGQPSGGPGARRLVLERFWVPLGTPFGSSKMLENALESHLKFVVNSELSFGPSGGSLGHFGGQF